MCNPARISAGLLALLGDSVDTVLSFLQRHQEEGNRDSLERVAAPSLRRPDVGTASSRPSKDQQKNRT